MLWVKCLHVMKKTLFLAASFGLVVSSFAQTSDTLRTAVVLGDAITFSELRTASDEVLHEVVDVASYLSKDSRFQSRQYAPGSVATVQLGGANSAQSKILWDGIDISSMASGVVDLSLVPAALLGNQAVKDGSNAGFSGSTSMIGGINLGWKATGKKFFTTLFQINNIGGQSYVVSNGGHFGTTNYRSFVGLTQSTNTYPYTLGSNTLTMNGMGFSTLQLLQQYNGKIKRTSWSNDIWFTQGTKSNRGSILTSGIPSELEDTSLRLKSSLQRRKNRLNLFLGTEWQSYTDTLSSLDLTDTNTYTQFTGQYAFKDSVQEFVSEFSWLVSGGTSREASKGLSTVRYQRSLRPGQHALVKASFFNGKPYFAGAYRTEFAPVKWVNIQWSLGTYYRIPTMNELFWNPGGNPNLQGERSLGSKLSFKKTRPKYTLFFTTDQLFFNQLIQWAPTTGSIWSPQNIEDVYLSSSTLGSQGDFGPIQMELSITHQISRVLEAAVTSNTGKSLIYRPQWNGIHTVEYSQGPVVAQVRTYFISKRFTTRDNSETNALAPELWSDLSLIYKIRKGQFRLLATAHNWSNTARYAIPYFPLPGRYYSLTLQLNSKRP